ncbi:hypothetical protein N7474_000715 [Penicillium riverlandense]|uniref:uncharacterized protein n=1 Tax=Penicillium riverlandense TaxID=1903569 RepID=UPI002548018B|nr:uncharacterized protein N7474_000715 [Penicillium riverlandense]KAJ5832404.1 hypothetical protein N7474_000715 [Penicillium riverlandense]
MTRVAPRSSWMTILAMALLAVCAIHAHPLPNAGKSNPTRPAYGLRPRRIIPDTTEYLSRVFATLDLLQVPKPKVTEEKGKPNNESQTQKSNSTTSSTSSHNSTSTESSTKMPMSTPMAHATPASDPTPASSAVDVSYTETFKHDGSSYYKPAENLQIGPGLNNGKLTVDDIPIIFSALYKTLSDRFRNMLDSSDEVSLRR